MRGFGKSTPMPRDFRWDLDVVAGDFSKLVREIGVERVHVVGAKIGATVARRFAARYPDQVSSLVLVGAPPPRREHKPGVLPEWLARIEKEGVASWARNTMGERLGRDFPPEGAQWWAELMGRTPLSTALGFVAAVPTWDVADDLARIKCPTLVITTEGSALGATDDVRAWQQRIPDSKLLVLPGDSFHVAATHPDRCAEAALEFFKAHGE
jgi:pimeloyl-ACP methyl ester carboxylesterase